MKDSKRKFLSQSEYDFIIRRIQRDRADANIEKFNLRKYIRAAGDFKLYAFGFIFYSCTVGSNAYLFFLPIIFNKSMGLSTAVSLCLNTPPYIFAGLYGQAMGWIGDRYRYKGPILVFNACLNLLGLGLMVRYLSVQCNVLFPCWVC